MLDIAYNISQDAIQAKHRPLTPNTIETGAFLTHTYAFTPKQRPLTPSITRDMDI